MHSGDMGLIRADGHLRLMGRYKNMLKIRGENVDPLEVEAYLGTPSSNQGGRRGWHPDARLSEVAVAFLQAMHGQRIAERGWQNTVTAELRATKFHVTSSLLRSFR
jgi:fatty-acyl-CoA synthase